jgi:hypothetical protein
VDREDRVVEAHLPRHPDRRVARVGLRARVVDQVMEHPVHDGVGVGRPGEHARAKEVADDLAGPGGRGSRIH